MPTYLYIQEEFEMFGEAKSFKEAQKEILKSLKRDLDKDWFKEVSKQFIAKPKKYLRKCSLKELKHLRDNYLVLNSK